jgi:hypothetical protein
LALYQKIKTMTLKQAVKKYKLDKRVKWFAFCGNVTRDVKVTLPCSGCSCDCSDGYGCNHGNSGCFECGYTGKSRTGYPVPALINGKPIRITDKDFVKLK